MVTGCASGGGSGSPEAPAETKKTKATEPATRAVVECADPERRARSDADPPEELVGDGREVGAGGDARSGYGNEF